MSQISIAKIKSIILLMLFSLVMCEDVFAYTDPGTDAFIWQLLAAALIGIVFQVKKIIAFIRKKATKK